MAGILAGITVIELASWVFVPSATAILADLGADVIKIEHPTYGDPVRGLDASALPDDVPNILFEQGNRGKRSVGLDVTSADGKDVLRRLVQTADVFATNWLGKTRRREHLDVDDVRAWNPDIIYARGTGLGPDGDEADRASFDATAYWYRAGFAHILTPPNQEWPIAQRLGIGDLPSGAMLAAGIMGALFARERTGEASLVDVSLLSTASWVLAPDIVAGKMSPEVSQPVIGRGDPKNPLANLYRTKDDRIISLVMMESDRYWADFCTAVGRPELVPDERFSDSSRRSANASDLIKIFDEVFTSRTLAEWRPILSAMKGAWGVVQNATEVAVDPQVEANDYLTRVDREGAELWLTRAPFSFDRDRPALRPTPQHGEHTDTVLQTLGFSWDEIVKLKVAGVVL
ncbi:CoA transferase [Mycobacterium sp. 94-17]|uniref:CaiB/BaiF CoA transferase family protein n=1 Tax=Mycobacterium sp. 94-17 TaxID=2986147 RepID=UPI002D1E5702|nr:CoA transferase [Mycobacterium sp. 94-17]MEB4209741.1 CoA transferase [Mycobacterium sp. 94-17]